MKTPICDFVRKYAESRTVRMHMPGHKGRGPLGIEALDITEISGADALYEASGIIAESERNAAELFGTEATFYGTEGSSQMIRAMLYLAGQWARARGKSGRIMILAARNVHKSFIQACALLDYDVEWLYGEEPGYLSCVIRPETLENLLKKAQEKAHRLPDAFFITSPDYLGKTADIRALAGICHRYDMPLFVDNAHGAYLHFLREPQHPMDLGADLCCDSAHKTLPVLTGGAYLHVGKAAEERQRSAGRQDSAGFFAENARSAQALFGSTSPSYLVLQSLDSCNAVLSDGYREKLRDFVWKLDAVKEELRMSGIPVTDTEPLKLTIEAQKTASGFSGTALSRRLREYGIECEYADSEHLVLMPGPENTDQELLRLREALLEICSEKGAFEAKAILPALSPAEQVLTIREAVFAPHETVPVREAVGRIAASPTVSCPPAVPIVVSGERISEAAVQMMQHYGIETVEVTACDK